MTDDDDDDKAKAEAQTEAVVQSWVDSASAALLFRIYLNKVRREAYPDIDNSFADLKAEDGNVHWLAHSKLEIFQLRKDEAPSLSSPQSLLGLVLNVRTIMTPIDPRQPGLEVGPEYSTPFVDMPDVPDVPDGSTADVPADPADPDVPNAGSIKVSTKKETIH